MANCAVCGKPEEEISLYDGIYGGLVKKICYSCSLEEKVALIRKPTQEQLQEADKRHSVRELMEKMSSPQKKIMTKDQAIAHKNLAKIRFPAMKQEHGDLVQNYDWIMKQARRHMKLSTAQLAERARVDKAQVEALESGQIFANFEKVADAVEKVLAIKILRRTEPIVRLIRTPEENKDVEEEVLEDVKVKVRKPWFSFLKRKDRVVEEEPEVELQDSTETASAEISAQEVAQIERAQEEEKMSPWMKSRKKELETSPYKKEKPAESMYHSDEHFSKAAAKYENVNVEELNRRREERRRKQEDVKKEMEKGEFDFSRKENLDKLTLHDLAEMKKKREMSGE